MAETTLIETMRYLGVEHDDAADLIKMNRVTEIAGYFGQFQDGINVLRRVATKIPKADRVDRVLEYVSMRREHDQLHTDVSEQDKALVEKRSTLRSLKRALSSFE